MNRIFLTTLLSFALFLIPVAVTAQTPFDPGTIVPQCGNFTNGAFRECSFCDFMQLVRNVLNFILFMTMVSAGALFAWAGWLLATSTGNPTKIGKAKEIFMNVLIGLVLVLGAYTIINTLMKMLVTDDFSFGSFTTSWSVICPAGGATQFQQNHNS